MSSQPIYKYCVVPRILNMITNFSTEVLLTWMSMRKSTSMFCSSGNMGNIDICTVVCFFSSVMSIVEIGFLLKSTAVYYTRQQKMRQYLNCVIFRDNIVYINVYIWYIYISQIIRTKDILKGILMDKMQ